MESFGQLTVLHHNQPSSLPESLGLRSALQVSEFDQCQLSSMMASSACSRRCTRAR